MTAPDRAAAAEIAARAMREKYGRHDVVAEHLVAALDAARLLRRPDEAEYVAALEAVAAAARAYEGSPDDDYSGALRQAMVDALDAVPVAAAGTGSGEAALCVHCDAPIRALADTHCPSCGCPWDGD